MPTNQKRISRKKVPEVKDYQLEYFRSGKVTRFGFGHPEAFWAHKFFSPHPDERRGLWELLKNTGINVTDFPHGEKEFENN